MKYLPVFELKSLRVLHDLRGEIFRLAPAGLKRLVLGVLLVNLFAFALAAMLIYQSYQQNRLQAGLAALFMLMMLFSTGLTYWSWKRQREAIEALSKQEAKYRTVADYTFDWEYWQGPDQKIIYMTPACERVTGYSQAEFIADPDLLMRIIYPEDRPVMERHFHDITRGVRESVDFRIVRRDGEIRWITHYCRVITGDDGRSMGHRASNRDVTAAHQAQAALRASEEKLRGLYELAPLGIALTDMQGHFVDFNRAFLTICGYSEQELRTLDYWMLTPEKYAADEARQLGSLARTGRYGPYEKEYRRKDGSLVPLRLNGVLIKGADGKDYIWSIVEDITDRKRSEEALKRQESLLRTVLDSLPIGVWVTDTKGTIQTVNEAGRRIWGGARYIGPEHYGEYTGWWHDTGKLIEAQEWAAARAIKNGETSLDEVVDIQCFDGTRKTILNAAIPLRDDHGEIMGAIIVNQDITERIAAEAALLQSNADLEQFAYSVSHDMRQPLRTVVGHLQLLERGLSGKLDDEDRENLNFALDGARRMDEMIVSLLDYSRVGRKTESKRWMSSKEALDEALGFLAPAIEEAGAELKIGGQWPRIFASRDEMTRLFQNLIGNAVKYHATGQSPRIEVESAVSANCWRVSVRDNGIGIDPRQIDRLFHFFSRLQSRARFEGTGMGLALCRRIVEHHGGRIWAESAGEGQGSTFIFELPIRQSGNEIRS
jgi:PAS domain S-box-containing protein